MTLQASLRVSLSVGRVAAHVVVQFVFLFTHHTLLHIAIVVKTWVLLYQVHNDLNWSLATTEY